MTLLLLPLLACSDYDLGAKSDDPSGRRPQDSGGTADTDTDRDSGRADSGGSDVPDDTGPDWDLPSGKLDVALVVDVAYVYDCYHADVALHTANVVDALLNSGADVTISISSFDDYQVDGEWFAAAGGKPFTLRQQQTTDGGRLASAASGLSLDWGGDGPGSGLEAIAQVSYGNGYDQDCDGAYDGGTDVRPFRSRSSDAFGGGATGAEVSSTPGTGVRSGVGWRDGSTRVVAVLAENAFRDNGEGHTFPSGACSPTRSRSTAIDALTSIDARFLGVNAYEFQDIDPLLQEQLEEIARGTSSSIDADADGARDDVAVLSGSWDWPATDVLVRAIFDLAR